MNSFLPPPRCIPGLFCPRGLEGLNLSRLADEFRPKSRLFLENQLKTSEPECLKGQSNEIFDLQFFSSFKPALATDQWVKIFSILVKNSQSRKSDSPGYHTPASQTPSGIISR